MKIMLLGMGVLFGAIAAYKIFQSYMINQYMSQRAMGPTSVSATKVLPASWQPRLTATGTLTAINGVDITTEVQGLITKILFTPGQAINKGDLIVELNAATEIAELHALEAEAELSQITYDRDQKQFTVQAVSQATLDTDAANLKSALAQVEQQKALIDKKRIRAPFTGRLGISAVNLGQYLAPGDKIVTLQALDPIYVKFTFPQQDLSHLKPGQTVSLMTNAAPGLTFEGKITSLDPKVDPNTRNVEVEATLANPHQQLLPGMFGVVEVKTGAPKKVLVLPQEAISYNPYGDIVYTLKKKGENFEATQKFVTVGETRDDKVQILKGLVEGDLVVTAGQLKLKNGSLVTLHTPATQ